MRLHARAFAVAASLICLASAPILASQQPPPPAPAQAPAPAQEKASANTVSGDLLKVDAEAKTITVKAADGVESVIGYNDKTEVTGARGVAGLATMKDQKVTVTFTEDSMTKAKTASKIAVQARAQ